MPKLLLKIAAGLIAIFLLVLGMVAVALPRLIDSEDFQSSLREAAAKALGSPVEWQSMEAGILPPRLTIRSPTLIPEHGKPDDSLYTATSIELRLAILPIFQSRLEVASLVVHGAEIVVIRTAEGFLLPPVLMPSEQPPASETPPDDSGSGSFDLAIRRVVVSDSRIIISDRTLSPAVEWRIEGLDLAAGASLATASLAIEMGAQLQSGEKKIGRIDVTGDVDLDGSVDLELEIDDVLVGAFAPYLDEVDAAGVLSGRILVAGTTLDVTKIDLDLDLRVEEASVRAFGGDLGGLLRLQASRANDEPVDYKANFDFEHGGSAEAVGRWTVDGDLETAITLEAFDLAPFGNLAGPGVELSGAVNGEIEGVVSSGGDLSRLKGDLRIAAARYANGSIDMGADADLTLGMEGRGPIRIDADLRLADGGQLDLDGTSTIEGLLDLRAKIVSLDLAIMKPFLPEPKMELGGLATGKARLVGSVRSPEFIELDVHVESGLLRVPDYEVVGPFDVDLRIDAPLSGRPRGRINADLTAASLDYQGVFKKRAGMRADMTTKFSPADSGEIRFESRIKFRDLDEILLQGSIGESTSIAISAPRFNLKGWSEVFRALEPYSPDGIVSLDAFGIDSFAGSPSRFRGRVLFEGLALTIPDVGRAKIHGSMLGVGTKIRTEDLRLILGGTTLGIEGAFEDPLESMLFDVAVQSLGAAEANDLFSALSSAPDTVFGDLEIAGNLSGAVGSDSDLFSSLKGALQVSVGKVGGGRLRGVSILQTVLDQLPILGGAARLSQPFRAGKSVDDYFTEEFEVIDGNFAIGDGKLDAKTLRLVYEGYEVNLTGPVLLPSLEIDMTGELLLKADLVSALGGLLGASIGDRKPVRIPLARVTDTLAKPKITMTSKTLAAVPKLIFKSTGLDTLTLGVGRALGRALGGGEE